MSRHDTWLVTSPRLAFVCVLASIALTACSSSHSPSASHGSELASPDTTLYPARGCAAAGTSSIVTITINPDTPVPDCAIVSKSQHLRVVNATNAFSQRGSTITVRFAGQAPRVIARGQSAAFATPFGDYLAPGEHSLLVFNYHPGLDVIRRITIWLR